MKRTRPQRNKHSRRRHQQRTSGEWTATGDAQRATKMRDAIVAMIPNPVFRNDYRHVMAKEIRRLVTLSHHSDAFTETDILDDYRGHSPGTTIETFDDTTINAITTAQLSRLQAGLELADVFIVAPAMHRVLAAATATITGTDIDTLRRDDIPWETGFLVLPKPVRIEDSHGNDYIAAISWRISSQHGGPALSVQAWSPHKAYHHATTGLQLWPSHTMATPLDGHHFTRTLPPEVCLPDPPRPDWDPDQAVADAGPETEYHWVSTGNHPMGCVLAYLFAFLRIAAQPMTITPRLRNDPIPGIRQPWEAVRVVQLRQFHRAATADQPARQVNWQHSWIVRMHKVRQWYPSDQRHKVIFRGPYLKGPDDAPLLAGEQVHALVR